MNERFVSRREKVVQRGFSVRSGALVDNLIREYMDIELGVDIPQVIGRGDTYEGGFVGMIHDPRFFHYTSAIRERVEQLYTEGTLPLDERERVINAYRGVMRQKLDVMLQSLQTRLHRSSDRELFIQLSLARQLLDLVEDSQGTKIV